MTIYRSINASGVFTIVGIPAGNYTLEFNPEDEIHAAQWWHGKSDQSMADRFGVVAGDPKTGMDVQLAAGGSISGTVTGADGKPLAGVEARAYLVGPLGRTETQLSAETNEQGAYTITRLPAGEYAIHFAPSDGVHASKWWSSGDVVLDKGAIVSGTVTDLSGNPVADAAICLFWRPSGDGGCGAVTDAEGRYTWPGALDTDTYDMAVWIGGWETGTRHDVDPVVIGSGMETVTHNVVLDTAARRLAPARSGGRALTQAAEGELVPVAAGAAITGKNMQLPTAEESALTKTPIPVISGSPRVGATLIADPGQWEPAKVSLTYQWYRGASLITGAASRFYLVAAEDLGLTLSVRVTGSKSGYVSVTKASAPSAPVTRGVLALEPRVSDTTPAVDQVLTASGGTPASASWKYQWYRRSASGKTSKISGATKQDYKVKPSDRGYRLRVSISGSAPGYTSVKEKVSAWTAKVSTAHFAAAPAPLVSGVARVSMRLTAAAGTWSPSASLKYQWYRVSSSGKNTAIRGATKSSYVPTNSDKGRRLKLRVQGSRSGYETTSRYSALTAKIQAGMTARTPRVSDSTPTVGQLLTAYEGAWTPSDVAFSYQWYAKSKAGKTYTISGATSRTYQVEAKYAGYTLKVKVTGHKTDFASVAKTSKSTSRVAKARFSSRPIPTITGVAQVGQALNIETAGWLPAPDSFSYSWYRSGKAIVGKRGSVYVVTAADLGKRITAKITATRAGYASATAVSRPVGPVVAAG